MLIIYYFYTWREILVYQDNLEKNSSPLKYII